MSHVIAGRLDDLPTSLRHRLGAFRHKVFVQRLHWEIPGVSADATAEWDEFDGGDTIQLVALATDGTVCGCARLMPTTGPCLLRDVFPQLVYPESVPSSPSIWEMSRFAGTSLSNQLDATTSGMSLFPYSMALAASFGVIRLVGVLTRSVARLYRRYGLALVDLGHGGPGKPSDIVACAIDLTPASFSCIHCDAGTLLGAICRLRDSPTAQRFRIDHPRPADWQSNAPRTISGTPMIHPGDSPHP
ncbi:MAG: acyl-homoserine-lactone synthase [Paraburkholderia sp.]|jgi:N-acyl-L-homoserine lactone synthetase|uniref:acyl-homoserine-lactone synthase n=1 Tax=unclassified Paraburkholderia TaxID=2615204 RepID=UPI0028670B7B|nr:acyl-homoserine-lactone synthase [Paraburkholderia sp. USG1]MDR8394891.1 N-acyl homoserine lactone synthase [Paraburkholderia sp. USG1]